MTKSHKKKPYTQDQVLKWYHDMVLIRKFEERAEYLYQYDQKIRGFCHLYIGQEAVAVGLEAVIKPEDIVITAYRDHGGGLARGMDPNACMAELYGKATGSSNGKGGSMHFFSQEKNFAGGHGIVGGQIPLGTGIAFAQKYQNTGHICVCMMGDGAVRQGAFHEAFNIAMTWKLPVLYIIENNGWAMGTSVARTSNVTELHTLGESYDMPAAPINGMNLIEVIKGLEPAVAHVRSGKGPYLIEAKTYRYRGHSMSDPQKYRDRKEIKSFEKAHDPIATFGKYLLKNKYASAEVLDEIDQEVKKQVMAAEDFAETSPLPEASDLYRHVYVGDYPFVEE